MSVDRPPARTVVSVDPNSPSRKSNRLQMKRQRGDEEPVAVAQGPVPKRIRAEDISIITEEEVAEHEISTNPNESGDGAVEIETSGLVTHKSLFQSPNVTKSKTLQLINEHCITDLKQAPRATSTPMASNKMQLRTNSGKIVQVVVKGEPSKALQGVRVATSQKQSIEPPAPTHPQSLLRKPPPKPVQASQQLPNLSPLRADESPQKPVPITARVYASAEKSILLKPTEQAPTLLNTKDAVNLVNSMKSVLKSLDKHTFTEEIYECATAIMKPNDAAVFRQKPQLIQQICGLTAISVVDIGISLFLFGPVDRLHKAKYLIEMVKEKGYEKLSLQETSQFQGTSLQFVSGMTRVQKVAINTKSEHMPVSQEVQETEGIQDETTEDLGNVSQSTADVTQTTDEDSREVAAESTFETSEIQLQNQTSEEQSLVSAMVDEFSELQSPMLVKNEKGEAVTFEVSRTGGGDKGAEAGVESMQPGAGDEVEYACDMCCISFDAESAFQAHTARANHSARYRAWSEANPYQCDQCLRRCSDPRVLLIHNCGNDDISSDPAKASSSQLFRRVVNGQILERDRGLQTSNLIRLKRSELNAFLAQNPDEAADDNLDQLVDDEDVGPDDFDKDYHDADFDPNDNEVDGEEVRSKRNRFLGRPGDKIKCMHCDKVIMRSAFESHCVYNHSGWTYKCPMCPHQANRRGAMQRHLTTRHKTDWSEGEVEVTIRGNISNTPVHTTVYMTGSHRKDYQCAQCPRTFTSAAELAHHSFAQHVPKQFVCSWCGRHFGALHHLTFHSALVHGRVMVADDTGSYTMEVVIDELHKRETLCNVCGEWYRSKVRHDKVCLKEGYKKKVVKTEHPAITQEMVDKFPDSFKFIHECDQCGYKTTAKGLVSHKKSLHFNNSLYSCRLCLLYTNTQETMEAHLKRKHFRSKQFREGMDCTLLDEMPRDPRPEDGIVICVNSTCIRLPPSVKTSDYYELLYDRKEKIDNTTNGECGECGFKAKSHIILFHQKHVHGPVVAECPLCRKPLREDGVLARHIATEHFESGTLVYSTRHATRAAGGSGVAREDIIRERSVLAEHDDTLLECATCHKMIKASYMRQHEKVHIKIATCEICAASFRCKAELKKHLVRKHTPAELVCKQCDLGFQTEQDLGKHMESAHDNQERYVCPHCPHAAFETERYLKAHMQRKHENPHRFACPHCGKMFYEKCKRDQHMRIHLPDSAAGRYRAHCSICNKNFKSERYLETHMNLHTKNTMYACSVCDRQFSLLSTLRKHQLLHSEDRPYSCDHPGCNRQFKTVTKLKYHKVTHTKSSPYVCHSCDKVFTQPWTLKKHQCKFEKDGGGGEENQMTTLFPQSPSTDSQDNLSMVLQQQAIMQAGGGIDEASGEVVLDTSQQVILKQEAVEEVEEATSYQCGQCNIIMDTMEAAMKHIQTHHPGEEGEGEEPEQAPPTSEFPMAVEEAVEHVSYGEAQQVQIEDLDGNQHYITLKLDADAEEGDEYIQLDDNTFVLSQQSAVPSNDVPQRIYVQK